jgi:hypothetical protein
MIELSTWTYVFTYLLATITSNSKGELFSKHVKIFVQVLTLPLVAARIISLRSRCAYMWQCQATPGAGMRTGRWQRVAAAWAVRSQPYPAVGAELPVLFDLAAAIETLLDELVKFFLELQE